MELSNRICRLCNKIYIIYVLLPGTSGQDRVNWPTVAVAWTFSMMTSLVIVGLAMLIAHLVRKKRKKHKLDKENSRPPYNRGLSVLSESSDVTQVSGMSGQPLYNGGNGYRRVPTRESNINRRKSDFISLWCSKHGLSEVIAANLRENGFNSKEQIESLRSQDVMTLALPNVAQQVQLREVLDQIRKTTEKQQNKAVQNLPPSTQPLLASVPSHNSNRTHSASSDKSRPRSRSSTAHEETAALMGTPSPQSSSVPAYPYSDRCRSLGQLTEEEPLPISIVPGRSQRQRIMFHGLLSDSGLYELADSIGLEWRHLAAILNVHKSHQERIMHDHPGNTKQQIYEMLRTWRDHSHGAKEEVKANLVDALIRIKRKDVADRILREQVHGSDEQMSGTHRMNSVV